MVGYQPLGSTAHDVQKGRHVQPPGMHAANMKKHYQHNSSSNLQAEGDDQSIVRIPADGKQDLRDEQPGLDVPNEVMSEDDLGSISIDQLCEENILLFRR